MILTTHTSTKYIPDKGKKRYVKVSCFTPSVYLWCEVGSDKSFDLRQGTCEASDLPPAVKAAADELAGKAFSYVDWPP